MFIIVGLGNPTRQYEGTKHNVGFDTIDYLIDEYQIPSSGAGHKALFGKGMIAAVGNELTDKDIVVGIHPFFDNRENIVAVD